MICIYCTSPLTEVRTASPWEFDLWCEPCVKHIGTASYAHDQAEAQAELEKIKRGARRRGLVTRAQAYRGR